MRRAVVKAALVASAGLLAWSSPPDNGGAMGSWCNVDLCLPLWGGCEADYDLICEEACDFLTHSYCGEYCGPGLVLIHCYGWDM